jgi:hypothetical protein
MDAPTTRNATVLRRLVLLLTVVGLAAGIASSAAAAASPTRPHIVAKPNNLMVNSKTTLTGTGFPAKTKLTIEECSASGWVVTKRPCNGANKISVVTDAHGRFSRKFKVVLCGGKRGSGPTSQICYIGSPHPEGLDTITLLGAAKITVTYP